LAPIIHRAGWSLSYIVASILVQHCNFHDIHQLPKHPCVQLPSLLGKLVFALSLLGDNFVLMLSLLALTLPLLRLNLILMHHHAHHVSKQKSVFVTGVHMTDRILPCGFKWHSKGIAFSIPPLSLL
jgi:hypothetical protein